MPAAFIGREKQPIREQRLTIAPHSEGGEPPHARLFCGLQKRKLTCDKFCRFGVLQSDENDVYVLKSRHETRVGGVVNHADFDIRIIRNAFGRPGKNNRGMLSCVENAEMVWLISANYWGSA